MFKKGLVLVLACFSLPILASSAHENLGNKLAAMQNFSASFTQKTFADGKLLQTVNGKIHWQQPDAFYWQALQPQAQILVGDGDKIYHYDQDLEQVLVQDYQSQKQHSPLMMILSNKSHVKQFYQVLEMPAQTQTVYELSAKDKKAPVQTVLLMFSPKLSAMHFIDSIQQKTEITFEGVSTKALDSSLFEFTVPEGVDVLHE